jgi:hypothetical protein
MYGLAIYWKFNGVRKKLIGYGAKKALPINRESFSGFEPVCG